MEKTEQKIENIELQFLQLEDYEELKQAMITSYPTIVDNYWEKKHIRKLLKIFPDGQVVIKVNGEIAGGALSMITYEERLYKRGHTYQKITDDFTFNSHDEEGDILYGIDIFIKPEFRGLRLGRRLYDYRKDLCEKLNLKAIMFGGRIPNYHKYAHDMTPKEYIENVRLKEIHDPVLDFQLSNDFHIAKILRNYLPDDEDSGNYAVLLEWRNIYYEEPEEESETAVDTSKSVVRLGLVQWQMRLYKDMDGLMDQVTYFLNTVSGYRCDFCVFPEFFNAPLMADYNELDEPDAIRKLAEYTEAVKTRLSELSISYNINIITGSMPEVVDGKLYNVGFLCHREGGVDKYVKIHPTPDEVKVWGMQGGDEIRTFDTDCGKIGILICYDVEFPELSRLLAEDGMDILFVPFLTDTQNGYERVRNCARARAIENECYVAIAGSVGNIPKVHNMDIQFAQSTVFTPCDFSFPTNGIKAEATPNTEMILVADVDINLLRELNTYGSVRNLNDRRKDLYKVELIKH